MALAACCVGLDRGSKWLAMTMLRFNEPVEVLPCFNLTLTYNTGASFSMLSDAGGWQRWVLSALALGFSVAAACWIRAVAGRQLLVPAALALIMGGALGNLWDRIMLGHVVDFIQVHYATWYFPVFNLADSAITLGAGLMLLDALREHRALRRARSA
jgi:signal peptidase II